MTNKEIVQKIMEELPPFADECLSKEESQAEYWENKIEAILNSSQLEPPSYKELPDIVSLINNEIPDFFSDCGYCSIRKILPETEIDKNKFKRQEVTGEYIFNHYYLYQIQQGDDYFTGEAYVPYCNGLYFLIEWHS